MGVVKMLIWIAILVGSLIGGYIPTLFGASWLSYASLLGNGAGSIVGLGTALYFGNRWGLD